MSSYSKANIEYAHIYADQVFGEEHQKKLGNIESEEREIMCRQF